MKVALLGDIALFGCCTKPAYFNDIENYLSSFDYVVGNLETPFSSRRKTYGSKSAYICASPESSSILSKLRLNAVNLANNHMFDYGKEGYELTKTILADTGIEWFGTEGRELHIEKTNNKIAFAGFCCYTANPLVCVEYGRYGVNAYNLNKAKERIKDLNREGFLPIISVHAGIEHVNYPSYDHIQAARSLSTAGSYVYYGHHPHVIQGVEEYNDSLLAYSLGNFCFDDIYTDVSGKLPLIELSDNNRTGMVLELTIENNKIVNWDERVIHIEKDGIRIITDSAFLHVYNTELRSSEKHVEDYNQKRDSIIMGRIKGRKSKRNMAWYLKRLRPRYMFLVLNARRNIKLYDINVKSLL